LYFSLLLLSSAHFRHLHSFPTRRSSDLSNIQLIIAFFVNVLLLIMGAAVFKSGAVKDSSFFGLYDALSNTTMLSNPILISVAKTGILSVLFAVALLASGQNSTITGTLTGQVVMEGFIHLKMPLWARRLF